jgi:hypothetical protein
MIVDTVSYGSLDLFLTGCSYAGQLSHEPLAPNFARISRAWKASSQVQGSIKLSKISKPRLFLPQLSTQFTATEKFSKRK